MISELNWCQIMQMNYQNIYGTAEMNTQKDTEDRNRVAVQTIALIEACIYFQLFFWKALTDAVRFTKINICILIQASVRLKDMLVQRSHC